MRWKMNIKNWPNWDIIKSWTSKNSKKFIGYSTVYWEDLIFEDVIEGEEASIFLDFINENKQKEQWGINKRGVLYKIINDKVKIIKLEDVEDYVNIDVAHLNLIFKIDKNKYNKLLGECIKNKEQKKD